MSTKTEAAQGKSAPAVSSLTTIQKIAKIRKGMEVFRKNTRGFNYTYVDEATLLAHITAALAKYHIDYLPEIVPGSSQYTVHEFTKTKFNKDLKKTYDERVYEVIFRCDLNIKWVNLDNPEDTYDVPWSVIGQQSDASQALGSGMTYCLRYFLLKFFKVSTIEDNPDAWRGKQSLAAQEEEADAVKEILDMVNAFAVAHGDQSEENRKLIATEVKKFAKEKGKATSNYYAIKDLKTAKALYDALQALFAKAGDQQEQTKTTKEK